MFKLPDEALISWTPTRWSEFISQHAVMELKIVESGGDSNDNKQNAWGEIARNMLNTFSQSVIVNPDEAIRRTVLLNATRGNTLFKQPAIEALDEDDKAPTTKVTYLFMINRSTELIG